MVHRGSVSTYLRFMLEIMLTPSPYTSNPLSRSSKNWMPLYNTVLIYESIYMKQSWYWVTRVPLKWSRQSACYGIQYWKLQIWRKFPLLGTTGIYFHTFPSQASLFQTPTMNSTGPSEESSTNQSLTEKSSPRNCTHSTISRLPLMRYEKHQVKPWRKAVKCLRIHNAPCVHSVILTTYFWHFCPRTKKLIQPKSLLDCIPSHMALENLVQLHLSKVWGYADAQQFLWP